MSPPKKHVHWVGMAALVALVAILSCTGERARTTPSTGDAPLAQAIDQAHFAFHPGPDPGFAGGHATYVTTVSPSGLFGYAPRSAELAGRPFSAQAPLGLETSSIARTGTPRDPRPAEVTRLEPDGAVTIDRGVALERWRNVEEGALATWTFPSAPSGAGDLEVRLRVGGGYAHAGTTAHGEHFRRAGADSPLGVRIGRATWIDRVGARRELATRWDEAASSLVLTVPRDVVDGSSYPAVLDPIVSGEHAFDAPITSAPLGGTFASEPVIASDGIDTVAVWSDQRDPWQTIWSARIVSGASPSVTPGFVTVVNGSLNELNPAIASDGAGYMVVFHARGHIQGIRLDKAAKPVGAAFSVCAAPIAQFAPRIAWGGTQYLATWQDNRGGGGGSVNFDIFAARILPDGTVRDNNGFGVATGAKNQERPDVSFDGVEFLVAWTAGDASDHIEAAHVTTNGTVRETTPIAVVGPSPSPVVSSSFGARVASTASQTSFVVVQTFAGVVSARIASTGAVTPTALTTGGLGHAPSVAFDGTDIVVTYTDSTASKVKAVRLNASTGAPLGPAVDVLLEHPQVRVELARTASEIVGAFRARPGVERRVFAVRLTKGTLAPKDASPFLLSPFANTQTAPAVGFDGTNFFGVWTDDRTQNYDIFGARIDSAGAKLDPLATKVVSTSNLDGRPFVASISGMHLLVWDSGSGIAVRRIAATGVPIDAAPILVVPGAKGAAVTSDGVGFLVAGVREVPGDVAGAFVGPTGDVSALLELYPPEPGVIAAYSPPTLAFGNGRYAVAWAVQRSTDGFFAVRMRRISADGTPLDLSLLSVAQQATHPSAAFDGKNFVIAFQDVLGGPDSGDIRASRVSTDGKLIDPIPIPVTVAPGNQSNPIAIATGNGTGTFIAWEDGRGGIDESDVYAAVLEPGGTVLDPNGFAIAATPAIPERAPAAVADGKGTVVVVYSALDPSSAVLSDRVSARSVVTGQAASRPCTKNDDCGSRHCIEGICCDAACDRPCETCTARIGTCLPVRNAEDPDSCSGRKACNAAAECIGQPGAACTSATECASGFCADGVCCNSACEGACNACDLGTSLGTCVPSPRGDRGVPSCLPFACNGASTSCPNECGANAECPFGSTCDLSAKRCVPGSSCIDADTLVTPLDEVVECGRFRCASGACIARCASAKDCAPSSLCNLDGKCVDPADDQGRSGGSCAAAPSRVGTSSGGALGRFGAPDGVLGLVWALAARRRRSRSTAPATTRIP